MIAYQNRGDGVYGPYCFDSINGYAAFLRFTAVPVIFLNETLLH